MTAMHSARVEETDATDELLRTILDVVMGWSRPRSAEEKLEQIRCLCEAALRKRA